MQTQTGADMKHFNDDPFFDMDDPVDESLLRDLLNGDSDEAAVTEVHEINTGDDKFEWRQMESFLKDKCDQLTVDQHLTWQDLYEQSYAALYDKYQILGKNEYALRMEIIRQRQNDSREKWYRRMPFHEHFAIVLAQKLARIFFVIDSDDPVEKKYYEAKSMFPFAETDLLEALKRGSAGPYDIINELQLLINPILDYRSQGNIQKWATAPPLEFIKHLLGFLKEDQKVAGSQVVHHSKDIMKIFKITHVNLLECRKVIDEYALSRDQSGEVYYHEKRRLAALENEIWHTYKALHVHNLALIGFLDVDKISRAGKLLIWKYLDRLTLSYLYEIAVFRVPLDTDIPQEKNDANRFTGDIENDLWVASFNRFWRLELLDYSLEWIRRLKHRQKWNVPSLKYLREIVPAVRPERN